MFITSSIDPELMTEVSKEFDEEISVQPLQNVWKYTVDRFEAAVDSRHLTYRRLSCGIVPSIFDLILNCSFISASASSDDNEDLSQE